MRNWGVLNELETRQMYIVIVIHVILKCHLLEVGHNTKQLEVWALYVDFVTDLSLNTDHW